VDVLQVHGTDDETVRYTGGRRSNRQYPSVEGTVAAWVDLAGARASVSEATGGWLQSPVRVRGWVGSARVRLWIVPGGGHELEAMRGKTSAMLDYLEAN
jgi:polyhydroxybutyrate depolymerase